MVNRGEVFPDVAFEHIFIVFAILRAAVQCPVRTFVVPVGKAVEDKRFFENRLNHLADGMVHYPVAVRCRADKAGFGVGDSESTVIAGRIGMGVEFVPEGKNLFFKVEVKQCHIVPVMFSGRCPVSSLQQVAKTANLSI